MFSRSLLAASIAASCSFAVAAETTLATTVVTATRTTQSVDDSLASVQVITQEQLAQHPSQDLGEILRFATGIDVVRSGGFGGQTSIFTRGTNSQHTLVLIDGVKINAATSSQANIQHLTLGDIERVEIVKGAMSTLYGSEAIGGVINIITKKATTTALQGNLTIGTDQLAQGYLQQSFSQGAVSGLLNLSSAYTNGYEIIDNSIVDRGYKNKGAHLKLAYDLGQTKLGFSIRNNTGTTEYLNNVYDLSTFKIKGFTPVSQDFNNQLISLNVDSTIGSMLNSQLKLSEMRDEIDQNQNTNKSHTKQQQVDWQNSLAINTDDTLILGVTFTNTEAEYNSAYNKSLENKAVYLQNQWDYAQASLVIAGRHEDYDSFGTHDTGSINLGYHFSPQQLVYVNAGTAFKAPDLNQLYGSSSSNPNLQPEESRSVEIGSKHQFGVFKFTTAIFNNQVENLITYGSKAPYALSNLKEAHSKGAELTASLQENGLFANLSGSYIKSQDKASQKDLDRRPRRTLTMNVGYQTAQWGFGAELLAKDHTQDFAGRIAGYAVANANAYWQVVPSTKLRLNIDNISDKTYSTAWVDSGYRYLATPFTASISADVKF